VISFATYDNDRIEMMVIKKKNMIELNKKNILQLEKDYTTIFSLRGNGYIRSYTLKDIENLSNFHIKIFEKLKKH